MDSARLSFLAQLPTLLNSSLKTETVIETALKHLRIQLQAEAATVFLVADSTEELTFWALHGGERQHLSGRRMPARAGIIGWVVDNRKSLLVNDAQSDPRFFSQIDKETDFVTKSMVCSPLTARGTKLIGAIQVINKSNNSLFSEEDLHFLEKFAHQAALAIENAQLYHQSQARSHQLAVLSRRKNDMMSVITHEFQTPINILQNSIELLSSDNLDSETRERVSRTLSNGLQRLSNVVSRIRDVSLLSGGALQIDKTSVNLPELFQTLSAQFAPVFQSRNQEFLCRIGDGVTSVLADHTLILVVLKNLIANAIRFTPDQGKIELTAHQITGLVELSVTDSGIGIEDSEKELIFEKFYEVTDSLEHSSGTYSFKSCGLGLGLPTTLAIVQAHGSSIDLKSTPGKGSSFSFRLSVS